MTVNLSADGGQYTGVINKFKTAILITVQVFQMFFYDINLNGTNDKLFFFFKMDEPPFKYTE